MEGEKRYEKVLSKEEKFHGALITVEHWQVALYGGQTALREIVLHNGAAAIVPVDAEGNVTLVTQYRVATGKILMEIPAGKKDDAGEDPLLCAKRELAEETGLRAGQWRFLTTLDTSPGFLTERIALYMATELTQGEASPDEDEFLSLVKMPLQEAVGKVMDGTITDAKTIAGLLMAWQICKSESGGNV